MWDRSIRLFLKFWTQMFCFLTLHCVAILQGNVTSSTPKTNKLFKPTKLFIQRTLSLV